MQVSPAWSKPSEIHLKRSRFLSANTHRSGFKKSKPTSASLVTSSGTVWIHVFIGRMRSFKPPFCLGDDAAWNQKESSGRLKLYFGLSCREPSRAIRSQIGLSRVDLQLKHYERYHRDCCVAWRLLPASAIPRQTSAQHLLPLSARLLLACIISDV